MSDNAFNKLSKLDVSEHVEKKGQFKYLSWAWAVQELRKAYPQATWEVIKTDGAPFCQTECGVFVEVAVTVEGVTLAQIHPVLDNRNKPIAKPSAFEINTSIQRCLVKAIALHGLGLYIYAGEDLPQVDVASAEDMEASLNNADSMPALQRAWALIPNSDKPSYEHLKESKKGELQ